MNDFRLFEIGNRHRSQNRTSDIYQDSIEDCVNAMTSNNLTHRADAVAFYMKRMDKKGLNLLQHTQSKCLFGFVKQIDSQQNIVFFIHVTVF